ncbi:MAG TPA: zf-HC2 domain-containing protein [Gaiellaceae bacterium]|nr:zf-HC2 domain-containing protein [Gaiellaceae bacterium]
MTEELSCRELVELVTDYLERALPPEDAARFARLLALCPGCTTYVEQVRETVRQTGRLREDDLEPAARDALLAQFRNWKDSSA